VLVGDGAAVELELQGTNSINEGLQLVGRGVGAMARSATSAATIPGRAPWLLAVANVFIG